MARMRGALCARRPQDALHVFAHLPPIGEPTDATPARLRGFARRWCLRDLDRHGTPAAPGLAPGLEPAPGEACEGLLLTLPDQEALWSIWRQAMRPGCHRAGWVTAVPLPQGAPLRALAFIADPTHPLHAGPMPDMARARLLARATGPLGTGAENVAQVLAALRRAGLRDAPLDRLAGLVRQQQGAR